MTPARVLVTPGSLIGINLVVRQLCAGREAIVEAPTYDRMLHALADAGAGVAGVGRDENGLDLARLADLAGRTPAPGAAVRAADVPQPDRAHARRSISGGRSSTSRWRTTCRCSRTTPTACCGSRARPSPRSCRCCARPGARISASSRRRSPRASRRGCESATWCSRSSSSAPITAAASRMYVSPPLLPQAQLLAFLEAGLPRAAPRVPGRVPAAAARRTAGVARRPAGRRRVDAPGGRLLPLARAARRASTPRSSTTARPARSACRSCRAPGSSPTTRARSSARLSFSYPSVEQMRTGADRLVELVRRTP